MKRITRRTSDVFARSYFTLSRPRLGLRILSAYPSVDFDAINYPYARNRIPALQIDPNSEGRFRSHGSHSCLGSDPPKLLRRSRPKVLRHGGPKQPTRPAIQSGLRGLGGARTIWGAAIAIAYRMLDVVTLLSKVSKRLGVDRSLRSPRGGLEERRPGYWPRSPAPDPPEREGAGVRREIGKGGRLFGRGRHARRGMDGPANMATSRMLFDEEVAADR